jgi:predicted O-methyltransferase YrrM
VTLKSAARKLIKMLAAPIDRILHEVLYNRSSIGQQLFAREQRARVEQWERAGRPDPPPDHIKHGIIRSYAQRFGLHILVETGTFVGDTPAALQDDFERIFTIELDHRLSAAARRRFRHQPRITVIQGESGVVLGELSRSLPEPVLFWLDGHWSGGVTARGPEESPILREAATILSRSNPGDVLLIDDARLFGIASYPSVEEVRRLIIGGQQDWDVYVENDIIRAHARRGPPPARG